MRFRRPGPAAIARAPRLASALVMAIAFLWGPPSARFPDEVSAAAYDRRGELLGASVSPGGFWRFPGGGELPDKYVTALLAYEDRAFFSHPGFNPASIARAALQNLRAGRVVSGGSTLSMQVARLARPGKPRTLSEKVAELVLALRLEVVRGKRGILELYAENAPFGGNVIGLEAASFRYFGRSPGLLSWAEAATLAVLPNAPGAAFPGRGREALLRKRDFLLARLRERGALGDSDLALALAESLPPERFELPRLSPQLVARVGALGDSSGRVLTTVDAPLQRRVAEIVLRRSSLLAAGGVYNAACLVARVGTGEVLAYAANSGPGEGGPFPGEPGWAARGYETDLIRASRSSGSLLKPFLYAAALDSGELGPRSLLPDLPTRIGSFGPENATGTYSGAVRADEALAKSLNVPFVRLLRSFGVPRFHALLVSTGMTTLTRRADEYGLALILGGAETSLWEISGRYAALARTAAGLRPPGAAGAGRQYFDLGLTARELGGRVARADPFSPAAAAITLSALSELARPEEEAAWRSFASARRISWKTGTSFGYRDAWAVGVGGGESGGAGYVVGVWAGNADGSGRPGLKGSAAAAPILFEVFGLLDAWEPAPTAQAPGGSQERPSRGPSRSPSREPSRGPVDAPRFRSVDACADSGWAAGPDCPRVETILLPAGARPLAPCPYCRGVALSDDGAYRVSSGGGRIERRFVLPPAIEPYYRKGHLEYRPLPPWAPGSRPARAEESLALVSPEEGASIYVPVEITGREGELVMVAAHRDPEALLHWHLDGRYLGSTRGDHRMAVRPSRGQHVVTVVDEDGLESSRRFEVLSQGLRP